MAGNSMRSRCCTRSAGISTSLRSRALERAGVSFRDLGPVLTSLVPSYAAALALGGGAADTDPEFVPASSHRHNEKPRYSQSFWLFIRIVLGVLSPYF